MNTPRSWNLLTSNRLRDLPRPQQFATLALAYLESAQRLCDDLADSSDGATFERGAVVLYLSAHAIELFLKGAILRKAPNEQFKHDLEHIHNRYKALFPAKRFAFVNMPFTTEYPGVNSQHLHALRR